MPDYSTVAGFVQQFPGKDAVIHWEGSGKSNRKVVVKALGSQKLVRVTIWDDSYGDVDLRKGSFLVADGKVEESEGKDGTKYHSISASTVLVIPPMHAETGTEHQDRSHKTPTAF